MSQLTSLKRILDIIQRLNEGKELSVSSLSLEFEIATRTVQRYFELIKEIYSSKIISRKKGFYQAVNLNILDSVLEDTQIHLLKNILCVMDKTSPKLIKDIDSSVKKALVQDSSNSPYLFVTQPYEEILEFKDTFKILEHAIKFNKKISIDYITRNQEKRVYKGFKAYKILFLDGNFYLIGEAEKDETIFVPFLRVTFILKIEECSQIFEVNKDIQEYINFIQTPWASYKEDFKKHLIKVILKVPKRHVRYFQQKKFLPTQVNHKINKIGDMRVEYTLTNFKEIKPLLNQWNDSLEVISKGRIKKVK